MKKIILFSILCLLFICPTAKANNAKSAILIDRQSKTVILEKNADEKLPIASTTKIMTALVVLDHAKLSQNVKISPKAIGVEGTSLYLTEDTKVTVGDLLHGLLLQSGNDAAVALACHIAGDVENFAKLMNQKCEELGMTNSHFTNPHGLPDDEHYSSARDMALLTATALNNELFSKIASTKTYSFNGRTLKNHNKLLWLYEGADGVKTGFTKKAGRCLVSSATRENMQLVCVTLNDGDDWRDHMSWFDYGFANYENRIVCNSGDFVAKIPVYGGLQNSVDAVVSEKVEFFEKKTDEITSKTYIPKYSWANIKAGQQIGTIKFMQNGKIIKTTPIVAKQDILPTGEETTLLQKLFQIFQR